MNGKIARMTAKAAHSLLFKGEWDAFAVAPTLRSGGKWSPPSFFLLGGGID